MTVGRDEPHLPGTRQMFRRHISACCISPRPDDSRKIFAETAKATKIVCTHLAPPESRKTCGVASG